MKLAAICITYKRPRLLETAIECFLRQDYPRELRELVILDDAGQYPSQRGDGWTLISLPTRFRTMGEKRNAAAALASPDVEGYCVWDDDDVYLPWHMTAAAAALGHGDCSIPQVVYEDRGSHLIRVATNCLYHGAWSYRRTAFEDVAGYPFIQSGQDQGLFRRLKETGLNCVDPMQDEPRPSYIYRWNTTDSPHLSALGRNGYEHLAKIACRRVETISPRWEVDWTRMAEAAI